MSVVVEIWDDDGGFIVGKLADFVDKYTLIETTAPESNKSSSRPRDKKLCGKRSCTNVKIRVYCDDHYLIPECTEYCVPRDSDEEGHYWCDYDLGRKVCHEGWYDTLTNCTKKKKECTPRNDTIGGHYDCDQESGEKICLSGWMGSNCTQGMSHSTRYGVVDDVSWTNHSALDHYSSNQNARTRLRRGTVTSLNHHGVAWSRHGHGSARHGHGTARSWLGTARHGHGAARPSIFDIDAKTVIS